MRQDFSTPTSSPLFSRKSPDGESSTAEGDFLQEIIKEIRIENEQEFSSVLKKDNCNKKKMA
jgi:hypothetical protein